MLAELRSGLDRVMGRRRQDRLQPYGVAVADAAAGERVDLEDVAEAIEGAGKTINEFEDDVSKVQNRAADKALVAAGLAAQVDLDKLNGERAAENERHAAAIRQENERHFAAMNGMDWRRIALERAVALRKEAIQKLIRTSPLYPAWQAALKRYGAISQTLQQQRHARDAKARNLEATRHTYSEDRLVYVNGELARMSEGVERVQAQADAAKAEADRLESQLCD